MRSCSLLLVLDEFGPDELPVVWTEVLASHSTLGSGLDGNAVPGRNWSQTFEPLIYGRSSHAKLSRERSLTPSDDASSM